MILESFLSQKIAGLSETDFKSVCSMTDSIYKRVALSESDWKSVKALLIHDKKNEDGKVNFVLLSKLGEALIDQEVPMELLDEAFAAYTVKA